MIGTKLAHYEITSHLGSGGMGDVYQATDSKLGRSVAIKLLPEAFTHDAERAARFEREARMLASLNHSNIAAIYGIEETGGRKFLVMELVLGETLAQRIKRGPIHLDEALPVAKQTADALEAAHEKGIIHRDLKPANIKITPQGQVKVLDFGLAKAFAGEAAEVNLSNSPTLSMAATKAGVVLGTAAYMSPEQAKGKETDRTTDIWAFGCVLYEILTGRAAFEGETLGEILGSVFKSEPDWKRLPVETPTAIRRLLGRCLQKDRNLRLRDIGDARLDIMEPRGEVEPAAPPAKARERLAWIVAAAAVVCLTALAFVYLREAPPVMPPEMRVEITTPESSQPLEFALSPDGTRLAFVANDNGAQRLWVRPLNAVAAQPLAGTDGADYPFWSPDSRSIGFFANGKLKRIEMDGGPPQTLADASAGRGGTWNRDGIILFSPNIAAPLSSIPQSGGIPRSVTHLEPEHQSHRFPQFLPDGNHFLFYVQARAEIYLGSLEGGDVKRLTASDTAGAWMAPGWLLYMQQGTMRAQALDIEHGTLTGNPVTVADPVGYDAYNYGGFSVSSAGLLAYRSVPASRRQLTWFDRTGKALGAVGDPDDTTLGYPELSPDGRRVAVDCTVQGNQDICLIDFLRGGFARVTIDAAIDRRPLWSLDGTQIVFQSNRTNAYDLYTKPASGAGAEQLLLPSPYVKAPNALSSDGRFLLYFENSENSLNGARDLWVLPLQGDRKPVALLNSPFDEGNGQFSPDGRWMAYHSNESGRYEVYLVPFPAGGGKWPISTDGGISPRWRRDGKELFFLGPDGSMMAATVSTSGTFPEAAPPVKLFQTHIIGGGTNYNNKHQYAVSSDGRFLINVPFGDSVNRPITLLQNWKPPAK